MRNLIVLIITFLAIVMVSGFLAETYFGIMAGVAASIVSACLMLWALWSAFRHVDMSGGHAFGMGE